MTIELDHTIVPPRDGRASFERVRHVLCIVVALGLLVTALPTTAKGHERCQAIVNEILHKFAIDAEDVRSLQFSPTYEQDDEGNRHSFGTAVWVRIRSCQGALVIDLTRACRVRQVYTRGACRLPGIKSSC